MSQSGQGTRDAGQTILVYNIMVDPWKKHPICVSLRAYPTVLPLPLGVLSLLLAAFSCPARVPPLPSPQVLFGGVSLPRTSAAPFLFLVGVALPVISQAQPALWIWAVGPLPAFLSPGPFLHSFYSWLDQPLLLSIPGKGLSCWSRGWGQKPRRKPVPEAPLPSWSPRLTAR